MDESLLEDSVFSDGGESSDFAPPVKVVKAKIPIKKTVAPKAQKAAAATKPKAVAPKKRPKPESDIENSDNEDDSLDMDSNMSNTPPEKKKKVAPVKKSSGKILGEIANESFTMPDGEEVPLGKAPKGASDKYKMISHIEHILIRPDTYIGSIEPTEAEMWVYNQESDAIEFRKVQYVPGLYKIFDEILVNAADNKQNDKSMSEIKVTVDRESGEISVQNDGKGIPIEMHKEQKMYIPEMIFGHLLTSSNYDDGQAKVTGGRNGYGAKLCNVFSKEFSIETVDSKQKKKYKQTWTENMSKKGKASIKEFSGKDYTKVTFRPDYTRFSMSGMDDDFEALVKRRIYDMAGTCNGVKVFLNGKRVAVKDFKSYMHMYTKSIQAEQVDVEGEPAKKEVIIVDTPNERWTVGFAVSDGSFKQVSFVNSIATSFGGTHVNMVAKQITDKLLEHMKKENKKGVTLKPHQIQNHMFLFVNCKIVNPAFTSQTKEQLTTKASAFGSRCSLSEKFLKDILKTDVVNNIMHFAAQKADQLMSKSDGSKRARMNNSKLTDANKAGTKDGWQCTLILTEGDSASGLALAGRAELDPDRIGVFPLRGKLLNVRDASIAQITNNQEIQNIKKFMGLQHKKEYTDTKSLRYGKLMIMTDQDHDGSHIKGLLINFFQTQFPSLLKLPNFLQVFITPIVKCWKGPVKNPAKKITFYTMPEYEEWRKQPGNGNWEHKYYKGLGTSSTQDAQSYFRDLDRHLKEFESMKPHEPELIELAFSKKKADARKVWLRDFVPGTFMDHMASNTISYDNFVNKELILFSMADNLRSLPSMVDGLKPSQRKVMYTCFRINLQKDRKVVELAGQVSGQTAYPYGEASLQQTIVGLAQTFVGSNNVNFLEPSGNFGSRRLGGQDAGSPRYLYTRLSPFARHLYKKADEPLLTYHLDDGRTIEPHNYVPILPVILLNGADGIGTGWSTSIPNYSPTDIVDNLKRRMAGTKDDMVAMQPWFRGFKGAVVDLGQNRWQFNGIAQATGDNEVEITELPVRYWTQDFKDKLEDIIKAEKNPSFIKDYAEYNTPTNVHFVIKMDDKHMKSSLDKGLEETFKLTKSMATSNLVAFDHEGRIHKYDTVLDIMEEFYLVRLKMYEKRKQYMLDQMQLELDKLTNQARFVKMIIDGKLVISKKKKDVLVAELRKLDFKPFPKKVDAAKAGEEEEAASDADASELEIQTGGAGDYDYLLGMALWSLTEERVAKLLKQIGDKEVEVDTLIKLTPKDIWNKELDDFIDEWHHQLQEEQEEIKKGRRAGRRASSKLGLGSGKPAKRKRKGIDDSDDDDDFTVGKKKKSATVKAVTDRAKESNKDNNRLLSFFSKSESAPPKKEDDDFMDVDKIELKTGPGSIPTLVAAKKRTKAPAVQSKLVVPKLAPPKKDDEFETVDDVFAAVAGLPKTHLPEPEPAGRRRAATKKKTYVLSDSDSEEQDDEDMLDDVSMMVKGIGTENGQSGTSRSLFANTAARPSSSHGVPKPNAKSKNTMADDSDGVDETDYKSLIPAGSPMRPAARRLAESDHDDSLADSFDMPAPKSKPITKKPAVTKPLAKTKPVVKPVSKAAPAAKTVALSPAAKMYAARQAAKAAPKKSAKKVESESEGDVADDILSDSEEDESIVPVRKARPGRAAAADAKKKTAKYVVDDDSEDEEEEEEEGEEESFMDSD